VSATGRHVRDRRSRHELPVGYYISPDGELMSCVIDSRGIEGLDGWEGVVRENRSTQVLVAKLTVAPDVSGTRRVQVEMSPEPRSARTATLPNTAGVWDGK
jgi:hypothetical protein